MSVFLNVNPKYLADVIHSAHSRVLYTSPGLDEVIASALINISKKIGIDNVTVVLDVSESVLRYGYGNIDGIMLLKENGISIKESVGLRIGALICDDEGFIFTPTPLLIEAGKNDSTQPNAIKATPKQVEDIIYAVIPPKELQNRNEQESVPEIGKTRITNEQIEKVNNLIRAS